MPTSFRFVKPSAFAIGLLSVVLACGEPSARVFGQDAVKGKWGPVFKLPNVAIHAHVLPDGKVLFWGRREAGQNINPPAPRDSTPWIWDPKTGALKKTKQTPGFNLFCSGHTFLADGRLLVVGGHIADGQGEPHATIYDPGADTWSRTAEMSGGRWYPTAITLPDGSALVSFGTNEHGMPNQSQQIWKDGVWRPTVGFDFQGVPPYYPRMHVVADGRVFMSGPLPLTQFLDTSGTGSWTFLRGDPDINKAVKLSSRRTRKVQEYAPSVMFDKGKILFIGGGNAPLKDAEVLDLNATSPGWNNTDDMHFARRQHNATLLPDGTVVVMGGTQGDGAKVVGEEKGFNDLRIGQPIHSAELWDPKTGHWTLLAKADVDRCYHSTAVLLPDATVLSAGGGEFSPKRDGHENAPEDTHKNAQVFSPPYLFRGARPDITTAPNEVSYGQQFAVGTSHPERISEVNWVRLGSVTHSNNMNQRINFLEFSATGATVTVQAPASAQLCPPGHYMLFLLTADKVPSVAKIIRIH